MTFEEFWPGYLRAHADPRTRTAHVAGTLVGATLVLAGVAARKPWLAVAGMAAGYASAWFSHACFERNRPQTFRAPVASLRADFVMAWHVLRGNIDEQLARIS